MYKPNNKEREYLQMNTARQNEKIQYYFDCIESFEQRIEKIIVAHERGEIGAAAYDSRLRYFNDSISKYLRRVADCEEQKEINAQILARWKKHLCT